MSIKKTNKASAMSVQYQGSLNPSIRGDSRSLNVVSEDYAAFELAGDLLRVLLPPIASAPIAKNYEVYTAFTFWPIQMWHGRHTRSERG